MMLIKPSVNIISLKPFNGSENDCYESTVNKCAYRAVPLHLNGVKAETHTMVYVINDGGEWSTARFRAWMDMQNPEVRENLFDEASQGATLLKWQNKEKFLRWVRKQKNLTGWTYIEIDWHSVSKPIKYLEHKGTSFFQEYEQEVFQKIARESSLPFEAFIEQSYPPEFRQDKHEKS